MTPGKWLRKQKALAFVNGCVWGAAIVAMGEAIRTREADSMHRPCSNCGAGVEHVGLGCPICERFRQWEFPRATSAPPSEKP